MSRNPKTCQYGGCLDTCENGVVITLRRPTHDGDTKAEFCCASHAAASLVCLAGDRVEHVPVAPRYWKNP